MIQRTPEQRRQQILEWLQTDAILRVDDLSGRLSVSAMTVHRDLDALVESGHAEKVYGGVRLIQRNELAVCGLCQTAHQERLLFVITAQDGRTCRTCCPHCGLLLLATLENPISVLVKDFLYGRMVNATRASYILESRVHLCCEPSVLGFANPADAQDFQRGFGGRVLNFQDVQHELIHTHHTHDKPHLLP